MPIDLSNSSEIKNLIAGIPNKVTPKLFDKRLTGNGHTSVGYFDENHNTIDDLYHANELLDPEDGLDMWRATLSHDLLEHMELIDFPFGRYAYRNPYPTINKLTKSLSWLDFDVYAKQWYQLGTITSTITNDKVNVYTLNRVETINRNQTKHQYRVDFKFGIRSYLLFTPADNRPLTEVINLTNHADTNFPSLLTNISQNHMGALYSAEQYVNHDTSLDDDSLYGWVDNVIDHQSNYKVDILPNKNGQTYGTLASSLAHFVQNDNVSAMLGSQATNVTTHFMDDMAAYIDSIAASSSDYEQIINALMTYFAEFEPKIDQYLTADDFTKLYNQLNQIQNNHHQLAQADFNHILSKSLRLLLAKSLAQLKILADNHLLHEFKPKNQQYRQNVDQSKNFSPQQKALITTTDPLTVGTAGAGSGKSHTLIGRLAYLKGEGEDLKHTLILSFTNTAADNIKHRYPSVNSITLGNLFNQMYSEMYPHQVLSASDTVVNSLVMVNIKQNPRYQQAQTDEERNHIETVAKYLIRTLEDLTPRGYQKVDLNSVLSSLSQLIADNLDIVIDLLDQVGQTTLEIQPLIIYNLIMNNQSIKLPKAYQQINYIITDESQDISTFEYILLTTLTAKYRANLMIIGDGTQTLYEFRSSNPQFLNAIEASGIFTTYKLTTNYRSNDAILQYANQFLNVIDANKYAHLQLEPNSLATITLDAFNDHVKVSDIGLDITRGPEYIEALADKLTNNLDFIKWLTDKVANHQQVACLAFTRLETAMLQRVVNRIFVNAHKAQPKILDITPDRYQQQTRLSNAIRMVQGKMIKLPMAKFAQSVNVLVQNAIINSFSTPAKAFIPRYVINAINNTFNNPQYRALYADVMHHRRNHNALINYVIKRLLAEEIHFNAVSQMVQKNDEHQPSAADKANADILISTIHSAKGLEFDNTVVLFNEAKRSSTSQSSLRLYGVALTRAKNNEYIINVHGHNKHTKRTIVSEQSGMFETPMMTAQLRCQANLQADNNPS